MISDQHLIPHGGLGQFCKGFTEMAKSLDWKVDLILDKPPTNQYFFNVLKEIGVNFVFPITPSSYKRHTETFAFSDSYNFEKMINFRDSLMQAFNKNLYDLIVCNTFESIPAAHSLGIQKQVKIVAYTHNESMVFRDRRKFKNVFNDSFNDFFNHVIECDDIIVGTQTNRNLQELNKLGIKDARELPMPMPERGLLEKDPGPLSDRKNGLLYIGRWEEGKNPQTFIKAIKETGVKAKVITNKNGAKKFEDEFRKQGINDFEIKAGVVGVEKVEFIKSAKAHFNPSLREAFCFAFFECLAHMPCFVLDKAEWVENFKPAYFIQDSFENVVSYIKEVFSDEGGYDIVAQIGNIDYVWYRDEKAKLEWENLFTTTEIPRQTTNAAKINSYETVRYSDFVIDLNRQYLAIDDVMSVLTNRYKYRIIYTDTNTYLTKDMNFTPHESQGALDELFE